jgi:hypothetical protein
MLAQRCYFKMLYNKSLLLQAVKREDVVLAVDDYLDSIKTLPRYGKNTFSPFYAPFSEVFEVITRRCGLPATLQIPPLRTVKI